MITLYDLLIVLLLLRRAFKFEMLRDHFDHPQRTFAVDDLADPISLAAWQLLHDAFCRCANALIGAMNSCS
jgi:hypothetical protein